MRALCSMDAPMHLCLYLLTLAVTCFTVFSVASTPKAQQPYPTPYQMLEWNGFPEGLLPNTVIGSTFGANGFFSVRLSGNCLLSVPGAYPVMYSSTISGTISKGHLSSLSGITVKVFFVWWPITKIYVRGTDLVFSIGFASTSYPASNFNANPVCGNGLISAL